MRSTDVDQVLSIMNRAFLWLPVTKTMTFGRLKANDTVHSYKSVCFEHVLFTIYKLLDQTWSKRLAVMFHVTTCDVKYA